MKEKYWYPKEEGKFVIEIKTDSLEQLFDKRDPNPYRIKDLDDDVVEYITSCAQEIGPKKLGKLRIITNEHFNADSAKTVEAAVNEYFHYRADITNKKIKATLHLGIKTICIGLSFLAFAIYLSPLLGTLSSNKYIQSFLKEGLLLVGWVSMWKPINIFLYEWWPLVDQKGLYKILAQNKKEIQIRRDRQVRI